MWNINIPILKKSLPVILILLLALGLRLYRIHQFDLWNDELFTHQFSYDYFKATTAADSPPASHRLLSQLKKELHPPIYYILVYLYSRFWAGGVSLRYLSLFFSFLSLIFFYLLSRRILGRRAGLYALALMAIHPWHIYYAQEARAYALHCFLCLGIIYALLQAVHTNKKGYWTLFAITGFLAIGTNYLAGFLLVASGSLFVFKDYRKYLRRWMMAWPAVLILGAVWFPWFGEQWMIVKDHFWFTAPDTKTVLGTALAAMLGYNATPIQYVLAFCLFSSLSILGAMRLFDTNRDMLFFLLSLLVFPFLAVYLISITFVRIYIPRQFLHLSPFYYIFVAAGLDHIKQRWRRNLVFGGCLLLLSVSLFNYYNGYMLHGYHPAFYFPGIFPKRNYSSVMHSLRKNFKQSDFIATTDIGSQLMIMTSLTSKKTAPNKIPALNIFFLFYPERLSDLSKIGFDIKEDIRVLKPEKRKSLHGLFMRKPLRFFRDIEDIRRFHWVRLWVISTAWYYSTDACHDPARLDISPLTKDLTLVSSQANDGICLELYTRDRPSIPETAPAPRTGTGQEANN